MKNQRKLNTYSSGFNTSVVVHCGREYLTGTLHAGHLQSTFYPAYHLFSYLQMRKKFLDRANDGRNIESIFTGGPDCHGIDIRRNIERLKLPEDEYIIKYSEINKDMLKKAGVNFTFYSPTHSKANKKFTENFFQMILKSGYVIEKEAEGVYCPGCGLDIRPKDIGVPEKHAVNISKTSINEEVEPRDFTPYKPIIGDCYCKGDGCGKSTVGKLEYVTRTHYHLDLEALAPEILEFLKEVEVIDEFRNEQISNLEQMASSEKDKHWDFTRNNNFGFDIPDTETGQKFYVWFDALLSYFSSIKSYFNSIGEPDKFRKFTQGEKAMSFYHIGKGITPHHLLFFAGMIIAYNKSCSPKERLNLPTDVAIRHHLRVYDRDNKGRIKQDSHSQPITSKMSKSLGNADGIDDLVKKYGADMLSYYTTKSASQSTKNPLFDEEFLLKDAILFGNKIGNLVNRVMVNIKKNHEGKIPHYTPNINYRGQEDRENDWGLVIRNNQIFRSAGEHIERGDHKKALETILEFGEFLNRYYDARKPWSGDTPLSERDNINYLAAASLKNLSLLLHFYTKGISNNIKEMLGQEYEFEWPDEGLLDLKSGEELGDIVTLVDVKKYRSMLDSIVSEREKKQKEKRKKK